MTDTRSAKVIVTRKLPAATEARLSDLFDAELNALDEPYSHEQTVAAVKTADVLVTTVSDRVGADVLAHASPRLKVIANFGAGIDHIDLEAARNRRIIVTNTPGVLTDDTADVVMSLMLCVCRRITEAAQLVASGAWKGWAPTLLLGQRLGGRRLGIISMGRIGTAVARRAKAFGMDINYHNRRRVHPETEQELGASYWESLDQMLAHMDIISVNCPHTPATYHLLSARRLNLLQSHAVLINTARGGVIDETALAMMLQDGRLAGAGLDVYENEPDINPELLQQKSVVLLPHIGSATHESREEMGDRVILNIKVALDGNKPPDWVLESYLKPI